MRDLYATLGVARSADTSAIRTAYRKASKRAHPDGGGSPEKFRDVSLALQVLTDPLRRKAYDETGKVEDKPADNEQSELMGIVSALLDQVLHDLDQQGVPFEHADLVKRMKDKSASRQIEIHRQTTVLKQGIERQRKLLKRFKRKGDGENLMDNLISGRLAFLEGQVGMADRQSQAMRKAELFLADYQFESERFDNINQAAQYVAQGLHW